MKSFSDNGNDSDMDVLQQAAEWFAILQNEQVAEDEIQSWRQWLNLHPQNRQAWDRIEALDKQFHTIQSNPARTAFKVTETNRRSLLKGLASLAIISPVAWLSWQLYSPQLWQADIRTAVGEIRESPLPDGGRLWLNTQTAVNIDYQADTRRIQLLRGEVYIETATDQRPFFVETVSGKIRSIGTQFTVHVDDHRTQVSVNSGKVAISHYQSDFDEMILESGDTAQFDQQQVTKIQLTNTLNTQWQNGVLIADNTSLAEFLDELSRYRHGIIRYDSKAAELKLTGSYPLADTDRIITALAETLPIQVTRLTPWWISIKSLDD